jgi:hypothetical protein
MHYNGNNCMIMQPSATWVATFFSTFVDKASHADGGCFSIMLTEGKRRYFNKVKTEIVGSTMLSQLLFFVNMKFRVL